MKYVALLRGINVGGKNTIKMSELKSCFETQGFNDVRTYINSGNIIFSTKDPETELVKTIEQYTKDNFGLDIPIVVRSQKQITRTVAKIPKDWVNDKNMRTDVIFLWDEVDKPNVLDEIATNPDVDKLIYVPGAVIWNINRVNYNKSKLHNFIGTKTYKLMTARNANTVRKLQGLMDELQR